MGFFDKPEVISPGSNPGRDGGRVAELEQRVARLEEQVARLLAAPAPTTGAPPYAGYPPAPTQPWMDDVLRLRASGKLIHAIKLYREQTGVGLKEAKDAVESLPG